MVHALYQHPLVISAKALGGDIQFDYFIVDSKLMSRIMSDPAKFEKLNAKAPVPPPLNPGDKKQQAA